VNRFALVAIAAVAVGLLLGVVVASGGDSGSATPSVPELKPPPGSIKADSGTTDQKTDTTTTDTAPAQTQTQTTPSAPSGGTAAPQNDTPQNDVAPPSGSPADRFEQFCKDNPGAC
jgi:hypothetical protein